MNHDDTFKANHTPDNTPPRAEIEARIVAWILGEASPFEAAELERLCAAQPELAVFKNRISAVHGLVATSAKPVDSTLRLSSDRRAKILAVISSEKVEGDLRAPSNTPEQTARQSASQTPAASVSQPTAPIAAADKFTPSSQLSSKPVAQSHARKSNVIAFASTMRQWAMPIAACFVLLLLVSATFAPKVYRASKAKFTLQPAYEVADSESEKQLLVVDTPITLEERSAFGRSKLSANGAAVAGLDPTNAAVASNGIFLGQKQGWFDDAPQAAQQAGALGGRTLPAAAKTEDALRMEALPPLGASTGGLSMRGFGMGSGAGSGYVTGSTSAASPPASSAPTFANNAPAPSADPFAFTATSGSLEVASSENRSRRSMDADKDAAATTRVTDQKEMAKLAAKGRSEYLAGKSDAAQETFRQLEAQNPQSPEAKAFLTRIANEKAQLGELNRAKARSQMIEESANAWQRPSVYVSSTPAEAPAPEWKPAILGKDRDQDSGVIITAGTPQKFTVGVKFTEADRAELNRRYAKKKALRATLGDDANSTAGVKSNVDGELQKRADALVASGVAQSSGIDWDYLEAQREVVAEIKLAEAQAATARSAAVQKGDASAAPTLPLDPKVIDSLRAELAAKDEAMSTFSLHVSDASYRLAKDALARGIAPNPDTIRPEEFYNAFDYGDPAPVAGEPVAARIEQSAHPFMQQRNLVRIAIRVPAVGRGASQPLRLTIMLDTSGSMEREDRAATVRAALVSLTSLLGPNDRVTLIGFSRTPRLIAENVSGDQAASLLEAVAKTPSEGGTNLEEALRLAETKALRQFTDGAQNRIVLLTDGATNLGDADPVSLATRIEKLRQRGVAFDACGIVAEGLNDNVLESLTRKGDGRYSIINSPEDADANFARQLAGAFRPAAKDVKVQVHFNPARVGRYRLIGFEQHRLKTEDFRNDAIDAAELASEEAATALYQVEVLPDGEGELGEVSVRFLDTNSNQRIERSWTIAYDAKPPAFAKASASIQLAGSAAFLAEKLRGGEIAAQVRLVDFMPVVNGLATAYPSSAPVREFITTFQQARRVTGN